MKKSEITKHKILCAAEDAFAQKGLYGARVDEIAENAGVNKRMIYAHFENKENLYIEVINSVYTRMAEEESSLIKNNLDCVETVKKVIEHYFEFLSKNSNFVKMVMWENLNEADYFKRSDARYIKGDAINLLGQKLRLGIEEGVFRVDLDIDEMVFTINMMCFSYFSNIFTMAEIIHCDFKNEQIIKNRCEHVKNIILGYICK